MLETSVDGVPVFYADGPHPFTAGLVFGVGRRDETFVEGGVTHLVEHLAMRAVGRTSIESNASVDLTATEFFASGSPDRVVAFLRSVCRALSDLPVDQLAVEADVLRAEGGTVTAPPVALLLGELYGTAGAGLASTREPALRSLTPEAVRDWAARFFRRGNAALWLSGPVPDGLELPLGIGPAPDRAVQYRRRLTVPAWGPMPIEERLVLGAELAPHPALSVSIGILRTRLEDELRHRRGVAYSVGADKLGIDADSRVLVVTSDVRPGLEVVAAQTAWREVHRLADEGPTAMELQQERDEVEAFLEDPRSAVEEARAFAHAAVTGIPALASDELRSDIAEVTVDSVREVAAALRATAVLLVPGDVEPQLPGLQPLPQWSPDVVTGRAFARKRLRGVPKEARLIVGEEGASLLLGEDRRITVLWRDAVGLVRQGPDEWMLVGREGFSFPLAEADWRDGAEAVALMRAAVPAELQIVDDDVQDDGLLLLRAPAHRVAEGVALGSYGATLVTNGEWTVVLPDGDRSAEAVADDLSAVVGRRTTALVLRRVHADVEYVLLRGATEVDRHRWGLAPGNARLLAEATERPESHTFYLLGISGPPPEVLAHAVRALGLPHEVPALLEGAEVAGERVEAKGIVRGFGASVRGDFVPPPGTGNAMERYQRLSRTRPGWFRAVNASAAVVYGLVLWALVMWRGDMSTWLFVVFTVLCGLSLLNAVWDARPSRREHSVPEAADRDRTPAG